MSKPQSLGSELTQFLGFQFLGSGSLGLLGMALVADVIAADAEERAELHESLRESIEQMKAGKAIDLEQALAELHAHR